MSRLPRAQAQQKIADAQEQQQRCIQKNFKCMKEQGQSLDLRRRVHGWVRTLRALLHRHIEKSTQTRITVLEVEHEQLLFGDGGCNICRGISVVAESDGSLLG